MAKMLNITGVDLPHFAQVVYRLSKPQGMGYIHYKGGELSKADAEAEVASQDSDDRIALSMDYVHGRACKMTVFRLAKTGQLFIRPDWFDHTESQLHQLLDEFGLSREPVEVKL